VITKDALQEFGDSLQELFQVENRGNLSPDFIERFQHFALRQEILIQVGVVDRDCKLSSQ